MQKIISIVIPVFNEEKNIPLIKTELTNIFLSLPYDYEIIFVNDGSIDDSQKVIEDFTKIDNKIKNIEFSRNFGKESAISAGLQYSKGDAVIVVDADLQHPVSLIPLFIRKWENGNEVVIGLRTKNKDQFFIKNFCSFLYYKIINIISSTPIVRGATDFRLIDRKVLNEFNKFTEHERISRGLIDWLGFKRDFVSFEALPRKNGVPSYSFLKLTKLAISSFISHSLIPLKMAGYLGIFIIFTSGIGGAIIFIERYIFDDVLNWKISGTAQLAVIMIFFIGIVLTCLGIIALYIANIHNAVSGRPMYVVRSLKNLK